MYMQIHICRTCTHTPADIDAGLAIPPEKGIDTTIDVDIDIDKESICMSDCLHACM